MGDPERIKEKRQFQIAANSYKEKSHTQKKTLWLVGLRGPVGGSASVVVIRKPLLRRWHLNSHLNEKEPGVGSRELLNFGQCGKIWACLAR